MKKVCLVNGSLRGKQAASLEFLKDIDLRLPDTECSKTVINVKAKVKDSYPEDILESLSGADAIIFIFPLHNYGLPGALMRLLEEYYAYKKPSDDRKETRVYTIVNCAFPDRRKPAGKPQELYRTSVEGLILTGGLPYASGPAQ